MPEQNYVPALLDGFTIGTPVNDHYGVCCYPAVRENRKYILKVISIPASQTQLDALLITGAYQNSAEAADYFRQLADNLEEQAQLLQSLSRLEGFLPYEQCQVEPMQKNRIGYQVYLLSGFRLSLERYMHRHTVSHLEAVNLGIDLCAALTACRQAGMLYIDLKPSNIFISSKKEYQIGDLGFTPLDSMKYTSMPEKYRSCYTPPELLDDLSVLNGTADTYALGMILYQIFNNGALPQEPGKSLPAPAAADEEMARILLKACAPDPAQRWEDPAQMGQALIDYMQRGTINDVPIMEPITSSPFQSEGGAPYQTTKFPVPQATAEETQQSAGRPEAEEVKVDAAPPEAGQVPPEPPAAERQTEEACEPDSPATEEEGQEKEPPEAAAAEAAAEDGAQPEPPDALEEAAPELSAQDIENAAAEEFSMLVGDSEPEAETAPETMDGEQLDRELKEMNHLLRSSERPIQKKRKSHPNVEPVVIKPPKKKKSPVKVLFTIFFLCLLLAASVWGYIYYQTEYLQSVNGITFQEDLGKLTVILDTSARDGLLSVVCTDPYGNSFTQNVRGGKAEFTKLNPGTFYTIQVQISGLHKLTNPVSQVYTTEGTTNVAALTAGVGSQDGSVTLSMIVEGHEPDQWQVFYTADGEPELAKTFTGHTVTVDNLVIGKSYSFRMELVNGGQHSPASGQNTVEFTPSQVIGVRDLEVVSCTGGELTVQWSSTVELQPEYWRVRCAGADYDETQEVTGTQAVFTGISADQSYTVEVCAKGMTQTSRITVSANPITLTDFQVDESDPLELVLRWQYEGTAPENGWMVMYTLDGSDLPSVVKAEGTTATIAPRIPGATYHFTFQVGSDVSVFNGTQTYSSPAAQMYSGHSVKGENISAQLLVTPEDENWSAYSLPADCFTQSFTVGQPISVLLQSSVRFYLEYEEIHILYVFRDTVSGAAAELVGEQTLDWHDLWVRDDERSAELNVPTAPAKPGSYTLDIYFNGMAVTSVGLTVN